jgi:hypothetical protein
MRTISRRQRGSHKRTRQLTVGMTKAVERCGTPWKPSSRNGTSNSISRSLQQAAGVISHPLAQGAYGQCLPCLY